MTEELTPVNMNSYKVCLRDIRAPKNGLEWCGSDNYPISVIASSEINALMSIGYKWRPTDRFDYDLGVMSTEPFGYHTYDRRGYLHSIRRPSISYKNGLKMWHKRGLPVKIENEKFVFKLEYKNSPKKNDLVIGVAYSERTSWINPIGHFGGYHFLDEINSYREYFQPTTGGKIDGRPLGYIVMTYTRKKNTK